MQAFKPADGDRVLPFQLEASGLSGRLVELTGVADEIISRHDYPDAVASLLGESLALAAALAGVLKYDGVFTLQTRGDGPLKLLVADVTSGGDLRGYAELEEGRGGEVPGEAPAQPVPALLGTGHLAFTVDQGTNTQRYQGIVEMSGGTLAECALHYFRQSEQIPTQIALAAGRDDTGAWRATALMLQQMPQDANDYDNSWDIAGIGDEEAADHWRRVTLLMETLSRREMLDPALAGEQILYRLFNEDGVRVFESRSLMAGCRCSRERVENVLRAMPAADLADLTVDGKVVVTCQFCNRAYSFDEVDLGAIGGGLGSAGVGTA